MESRLLLCLGLLWCWNVGNAQNLETIDWKNPIKLSGSLGGSSMFYTTSKAENRRDPFFWNINSNLIINVLGVVQVPFTLNLSQQNSDVSAQPFNQVGFSPSYKSVTVHAGYRSMEFSPFTLSGNVFLGGGLEVNPKESPVRVVLMYGRFSKAVQQGGQVGILAGKPTYERWGYGAKIGLEKNPANAVDLIFFKAKDDENSISEQPNVSPAENVVLGLVTKQKITSKIMYDLDFGYSVYTDNHILSSETNTNQGDAPTFFSNLMETNISTTSSFAIKTGIAYNSEKYQIRLNYQRINPNYRSMGTAFLNNDLEDISVNVGWKMLQGKITATAGGGVQRNNLNNALATNLRRLAYNFNVNYIPNKKLVFNVLYSNFNSSTSTLASTQNVTDPTLRLDSLQLFQVTNNAGFTAVYTFGSKRKKQVVSLNGNYQNANDQDDNASDFYSLSLGYTLKIKPSKLTWKATLNYNENQSSGVQNFTFGPTTSLDKVFKNKMKLGYAGSLVSTSLNGQNEGFNSIHRVRWSYALDKHSFGANLNYLIREATQRESFTETRLGLNYNYSF